jgi:hypothetical protein
MANKVRGSQILTICKLKDDARFCEGIGSVQEPLTQNANLPGKEAIETPNSTYSIFKSVCHHESPPYLLAIIH